MTSNDSVLQLPIRPRARLLQLLGDQLIGSARLAVFELVKNAYDADAGIVTVSFHDIEKKNRRIVVRDDGIGMSMQTIKNVWLVPGDDHREKQRQEKKRTKKGRLPLGEKGLGRFASHKLGNKIELITRASGQDECVISINWDKLLEKKFLDETIVSVLFRKPEVFKGRSTGTKITISDLRGTEWSRGEIRKLYRQIVSMNSPFDLDPLATKKSLLPASNFEARLELPGHEGWLKGIRSIDDIFKLAFWRCQFRIEDGKISTKYHFRRVPELSLENRTIEQKKRSFSVPSPREEYEDSGEVIYKRTLTATSEMQLGIGPISGEFYIFDRDRITQQYVPSLSDAAGYLNANGGIRVYRDGIRVYNYGEPGDDWLGLDLWRIQEPAQRVSNNIVAGAINIRLDESEELREKANREGFVENETYLNFKALVRGAIFAFMPEYSKDKNRIRLVTKKKADPEIEKIRVPLAELRKKATELKVQDQLEKFIKKIEIDYEDMRETMLHAGMSNLSLQIVFHEVVRGVKALSQSAASGSSLKEVQAQAEHLDKLLDNITDILRQDPIKLQPISKVIRQARRFYRGRLVYHKVRIEAPLIDSDKTDFQAKFAFGMMLNCLTNVLDNAIHWLQVRWPDTDQSEAPKRAIYIGVSYNLGDGPALVIADNGPGFQAEDTPEDLIRPFFTRKITNNGKRGTGLGLYYTNMALQINNARLIFTNAVDAGIPLEYDGAVVAFLFEEENDAVT